MDAAIEGSIGDMEVRVFLCFSPEPDQACRSIEEKRKRRELPRDRDHSETPRQSAPHSAASSINSRTRSTDFRRTLLSQLPNWRILTGEHFGGPDGQLDLARCAGGP